MFQLMFLVSCWSVPLFAINTRLLNLMRSAMIFRSFFLFSPGGDIMTFAPSIACYFTTVSLRNRKKYLTLRFWADIIFFILTIIVICCCFFFFLLKWIDKNRHCRNSDHGVRSCGYYWGQVAAVLIFSTLFYILVDLSNAVI